eukprot:2989186-Amphidinium_carterae.1
MFCERLNVEKQPAELYKSVCEIMAKTFATISEAVLISIIVHKEMSVENKRTRIQKQLARVAGAGTHWGVDVKAKMSQRILKEGLSKLIHD